MNRHSPEDVFKVLAVASRLRILELLKTQGPLGANRLAQILGISPAAVSQHLRVMRQVGLVFNERKGYWIPYTVDKSALEECRHAFNVICTCPPDSECSKSSRGEKGSGEMDALKVYKRHLEKELERIEKKISEIEKIG
jgi:ArsR family transcriptional regulator